MAVKVRTVTRQDDWAIQSFLPELGKGLWTIWRHFFHNFVRSKKSATTWIATEEYPEVKHAYPARFRGLHRLTTREDGRVRCVACMCCPTICPAHCITIVPAETDDPTIEKYPAIFEIDELRCVACGLCVEYCPCDAIRMDSGVHVPVATKRHSFIWDKEKLLAPTAKSRAVQGGTLHAAGKRAGGRGH
ncbi:MAG TPA: NADH-quinone oxidoreductase subunit I [Polyangia bacterium]|jgi:NADH-quinone oxidoreductase subunit I